MTPVKLPDNLSCLLHLAHPHHFRLGPNGMFKGLQSCGSLFCRKMFDGLSKVSTKETNQLKTPVPCSDHSHSLDPVELRGPQIA